MGVIAPIPVITTRRGSLMSSVSTARRMPASVRDAMPWMNTGPITHSAAALPMSGQRGPVHS